MMFVKVILNLLNEMQGIEYLSTREIEMQKAASENLHGCSEMCA